MIHSKDFIPNYSYNFIDNFKSTFEAPSNIALVKYWGKRDIQLPANPSISFTLKNSKTITSVEFIKKNDSSEFSFDFLFEGATKESFHPKLKKFIDTIDEFVPFLKYYHLKIDTQNTFPHSSGIASSASAMAALSACIVDFEKAIAPQQTKVFWFSKVSFLARLGSGSACRSIQGPMMIWGQHQSFESNDFTAVVYDDLHDDFKNFQDTILLVDKGAKTVSSSVGHSLMHNHPFAENRFLQAHDNLTNLTKSIKEGDFEQFIKIVESEALTLHAMMMTSQPYFILMKPNTLQIINKIWEFRTQTSLPLCFTLDAGANVHLLYPNKHKEQILTFIKQELKLLCENNHYICDEVGDGIKHLI